MKPTSNPALPSIDTPPAEFKKRYEVLGNIGQGGMSTVRKVYDRKNRAIYALKQLHIHLSGKKDRARFIRECAVLETLKHDNILAITDSTLNFDGAPALILEHCSTGSLVEHANKFIDAIDPCRELLTVLLNVASNFHGKSILHRDTKPSNILIGDDGRLKLADFGLSINTSKENERVTTFSNHFSPGFSPPEQYTRFADLTEAADIYAIGATTFFMYTGRKYADLTFDEWTPDYPLLKTISKLCDQEASFRPQSAGNVLLLLKQQYGCARSEPYSQMNASERLERLKIIFTSPKSPYPGTTQRAIMIDEEVEFMESAFTDPEFFSWQEALTHAIAEHKKLTNDCWEAVFGG